VHQADIQEEIEIARNVIFNWDIIHSHLHNCVLLPLHWSHSTYPITDNPPQKSINKQIVEKSDLLFCIFCSRLGSPTDTHISGSVEEIDEHIKAGKPVLSFFRTNGPTPQNLKAIEQYQQLLKYRDSIKDSVYWGEYENVSVFEKVFSEKLDLFLNDNWLTNLTDGLNEQVSFKLNDFDN
jgi:hypothetical protein